MTARFASTAHAKLFAAVRSNLVRIGYRDSLLSENHEFSDFFTAGNPQRIAPLAAFGRFPPSYETACFVVVIPSGAGSGLHLDNYRALGAPFALEVRMDEVIHWRVAADPSASKPIERIAADSLNQVFEDHREEWSPTELLRAKNISFRRTLRQATLFDDDLLPELEHRIKNALGPIMNAACRRASEAFKAETKHDPKPENLYRLAFWLLAGKVFRDRRWGRFAALSEDSNPDDVIQMVADHYSAKSRDLLTAGARQAAFGEMWSTTNFSNLSPEVLTSIWKHTFVTKEVRKKLGIHSTPRRVAEYVVNRLPIEDIPKDERVVMEPCCGSAVFLVAAMDRLRDLLGAESDPGEAHDYLQQRLLGFETESFGAEVARLSLMLADFPNPNGWRISHGDVLSSSAYKNKLATANVVLCNPPFERIAKEDRKSRSALYKPVEIIRGALDGMAPGGMLGFVLPHKIVDGKIYREIREEIGTRFGEVEVVSLPPNRAFETAKHPSALLLAHGARTGSKFKLAHGKVRDAGWLRFERSFETTFEDKDEREAGAAIKSLAVPLLNEVWRYTRYGKTLGDVAEVHRGIEWKNKLTDDEGKETGFREKYESDEKKDGFVRGVGTLPERFYSFTCPQTTFLCAKSGQLRRGGYLFKKKLFAKPKVIINASRKSQGAWRLAAFADFNALAFYQTLSGVWPHFAEWTIPLSAVLNGPIANAYMATHEIRHNTNTAFEAIPVPAFNSSQLDEVSKCVVEFREAMEAMRLGGLGSDFYENTADVLLKRIDAAVMKAYNLPARMERAVLDFFDGQKRQVPFPVTDFFPSSFKLAVPLWRYLSADLEKHSARNLRDNLPVVTDPSLVSTLLELG